MLWDFDKIAVLFAQRQAKVELFIEQREVAFLSPSKICGNSIFVLFTLKNVAE